MTSAIGHKARLPSAIFVGAVGVCHGAVFYNKRIIMYKREPIVRAYFDYRDGNTMVLGKTLVWYRGSRDPTSAPRDIYACTSAVGAIRSIGIPRRLWNDNQERNLNSGLL